MTFVLKFNKGVTIMKNIGGVNMKFKKAFNGILAVIMIVTLASTTALTSLADNTKIDYASTITVGTYPDFVINHEAYSNYCLIIDNYNDYIDLGFEEKSESFFNDNLLLINYIFSDMCVCDAYENTGVVINDNNSITVSYVYDASKISSFTAEYAIDTIEFKKSDVINLDLTKENVNVEKIYNDDSRENYSINMKHIKKELPKDDKTKVTTSSTVQNPTKPTAAIKKPAKVTKVKLAAKKKKLNVKWKKIKGVSGYQVKAATNKKFTKNKKTVNVKKNKATLKKLKSKKKYYIRVRAYQKIGSKTYIGKWSQAVSKKVK